MWVVMYRRVGVRLAMRLYGVYMRMYGGYMRRYSGYMAVYGVGYAVTAWRCVRWCGVWIRDGGVCIAVVWRLYAVVWRMYGAMACMYADRWRWCMVCAGVRVRCGVRWYPLVFGVVACVYVCMALAYVPWRVIAWQLYGVDALTEPSTLTNTIDNHYEYMNE